MRVWLWILLTTRSAWAVPVSFPDGLHPGSAQEIECSDCGCCAPEIYLMRNVPLPELVRRAGQSDFESFVTQNMAP